MPKKPPKSVFHLGAWGRLCRTLRDGNGAAAGIFRAKGRLNGQKRTKIKRKLTFNLPKLIVLRLVFARFLYHLYNQIIRPLDFRLHIAL